MVKKYAESYQSQSSSNAIMKQRSGKCANKAKSMPDAKGGTLIIDQYRGKESAGHEVSQTGTSIFDPVLCELAYRWFCPQGGTVLDPFAGGSVRGIVAAVLGRQYIGVDLSQRQIEANRAQWEQLKNSGIQAKADISLASFENDKLPDITPVEKREDVWFKREDEFCIGGGRGGKVRTCWGLAQGADGLITAGSRSSPQVNIVAQIARKLGIPCRVHTPTGELSPEVRMAQLAGAEVIQHKAGYNNVIIARARQDAESLGWRNIPFGMECQAAVDATARQVANIPDEAKRIVIPVGSGMSLSGLLHGLHQHGRKIQVIGVSVGADPIKRLDKYAPQNWRDMVRIVKSDLAYNEYAQDTNFKGVELDPIYEAKCIPFIEPGDLFWVVGIRATSASNAETASDSIVWHCGDSRNIDKICEGAQVDFVFSCPPYADLEVYSDDPNDLSTLDYDDFIVQYADIIKKTMSLLKDNRFACFVVGEVRNKRGNYYCFVPDTIRAFEDAGAKFYNEAILVTAAGSLPIRVGRQFEAGRKLGKTHQNVLIFCKGDSKKATQAIGPVEFGEIQEE